MGKSRGRLPSRGKRTRKISHGFAKVTDYEVLPEVMTGKQLEGLVFQHPFYEERKVPILNGDHVTLEAGTGLVHTAPDHGEEDFNVCQKYAAWGLKPLGTVGPDGCYTKVVPEWQGKSIFDIDGLVIKRLAETGSLLLRALSVISMRIAGVVRILSSTEQQNSGLLLLMVSVRRH